MPAASLHRRLSESLTLVRSFTTLEDHNSSLLTTTSGLCERLENLLSDELQVFGLPILDGICDLKQSLLLKHSEQINLVRRLLQTNIQEMENAVIGLERALVDVSEEVRSIGQFEACSSLVWMFACGPECRRASPYDYTQWMQALFTMHAEEQARLCALFQQLTSALQKLDIADTQNVLDQWSDRKNRLIDSTFVVRILEQHKGIIIDGSSSTPA